MKKFIFSLEKMLHYRDSILEEEKNKLMEIRMRKNAVDLQIENNEQQIGLLNDERMKKAAEGMRIMEMRRYNYEIETATYLIKDLERRQILLEAEVQVQLDKVLLMQQEVSGLEKLKEKQQEEYRQDEMKEQALIVSEIVSAKYIRQTAGSEI